MSDYLLGEPLCDCDVRRIEHVASATTQAMIKICRADLLCGAGALESLMLSMMFLLDPEGFLEQQLSEEDVERLDVMRERVLSDLLPRTEAAIRRCSGRLS